MIDKSPSWQQYAMELRAKLDNCTAVMQQTLSHYRKTAAMHRASGRDVEARLLETVIADLEKNFVENQ